MEGKIVNHKFLGQGTIWHELNEIVIVKFDYTKRVVYVKIGHLELNKNGEYDYIGNEGEFDYHGIFKELGKNKKFT